MGLLDRDYMRERPRPESVTPPASTPPDAPDPHHARRPLPLWAWLALVLVLIVALLLVSGSVVITPPH